ncbi:hypothetical protein K474DRAFT_1592279 [Panus rudis PR-1116 ss-1]|nr:hypothetical protein K474DRAFT_1592279 [Panus rudis PR-1116 ss-1]
MALKSSKHALDIRLTESVVFLRAGDATGRFRNPAGEPPAMLRGLLVLNLSKPTKISSIEVELTCKTTTAWPEGVGARRIDVSEEHKIYSQSYVYFDATSHSPSHRRTLSVGPGIAFDSEHEEDRSEESSLHHQDVTYMANTRTPPEYERRGRGLTRSERGRAPPRHLSVDQTIFQPDYVAHHHDRVVPTPPYSPRDSPISTPVRSLSRRTSFSRPSPMDTVEELQETGSVPSPSPTADELPRVLQNTLSSITSCMCIPRDTSLYRPPGSSSPSLRTPPDTADSNEFVLGSSTGHFTDPAHYSPYSASRATSPVATTFAADDTMRGRKSKRFNIANVSASFFDAVKERVRSVSHNHRDVTPTRTHRSRTPVREMTPLRDMTPIGSLVRDEGRRGRRMSPDRRRTEDYGQHGPALGRALGSDYEDSKDYGDGWKEFKSGVYTYPISFAIPVTSPPSIQAEYGSVVWRLKAVAHRPGAFKSKLSATQEVTVVASPGEDDTEDTESIIVERQWDDQMQYLLMISGRSFYIGGTIPVTMKFAPWTKMKIFKLSVVIEERVEYLTHFKRVARTDSVNRISLMTLQCNQKDTPLLPLLSDDPEAFKKSPLFEVLGPDDDPAEVASMFMGPGPWEIHKELELPNSCSQLHFTNKNKKSNIIISHLLKIIFRVQRGDDRDLDPNSGKRKLYDIVVQTPVHILSCLCSPQYTALPPYYSPEETSVTNGNVTCGCSRNGHHSHPPSSRIPIGRHHSGHSIASTSSLEHGHNHNGVQVGITSPVSPLSRNASAVRFERLITGQETELGEAPPPYEEAASTPSPQSIGHS